MFWFLIQSINSFKLFVIEVICRWANVCTVGHLRDVFSLISLTPAESESVSNKELFSFFHIDCGNQPSIRSRIVNGNDAVIGEWPWQISLHFGTLGHTCGATLINNWWLLSASHCFQDAESYRWVRCQGKKNLCCCLMEYWHLFNSKYIWLEVATLLCAA